MAPTVLDDFERANEDPLALDWTLWAGAGFIEMPQVISTAAYQSGTDDIGAAMWDADTFGPNVAVDAVFRELPITGPDVRHTVGARLSATGDDGYAFEIHEFTNFRPLLTRLDNGSATPLNPSEVTEYTDVEGIRLACIGDQIIGYFLLSGVWTEVIRETDSTYSTAGKVAFAVGAAAGGTSYGIEEILVEEFVQQLRPDADTTTTGWTSTPLFSKVNDQSDATVITGALTGGSSGFPTIPTTGANTLLSSTTTTASTTHTFPSLTTLAPSAGDLLIAICVQYSGTSGGSPNDQFSSWGASFTETRDDETTTANDLALGVAHKIATGSESGTFTVTSAFAARSVNFLMRIPAATWHGTTIPEVLAAVRASGAVPDPGSFNPANWDVENTLWIAVAGHSETSTTGSPPTLDASPTNYSGDLIVPRNADAVGHITAGVAFRQLNASAENIGAWTVTNAIRGNGLATLIAVRPAAVTPSATTEAELSLEAGTDPGVNTGHEIKARARKASGSGTVTLTAALYEGANNRSTDLTTSALTTSLADYTLPISEANAANITSYANLGVRVSGDSATGDNVNLEVAEVWLEIPAAEEQPAAEVPTIVMAPLRGY